MTHCFEPRRYSVLFSALPAFHPLLPARPVLQLPTKVAVVGGSGFIGSALVKRLLAGKAAFHLTHGYQPLYTVL